MSPDAASGQLVVISGPSGVGKSTVCEALLAEGAMVLSKSVTTRAPRGGERDGQEYFFRNDEQFQAMIEQDELLEWAWVHGTTRYGTPRAFVEEQLRSGKNVLLNIDVQGAEQLRHKGLPLVTVFLSAPLDILRGRIEARGDTTPEEIDRRLEVARQELAQAGRYDHVVVNEDLQATVARIRELLA